MMGRKKLPRGQQSGKKEPHERDPEEGGGGARQDRACCGEKPRSTKGQQEARNSPMVLMVAAFARWPETMGESAWVQTMGLSVLLSYWLHHSVG